MGTVLRYFVYNYDEVMLIKKDPEVDSWPLMGNPAGIMTILSFYLYFVLKFGPQLMFTKPPYNLQGLIVAFNFIMVLLSAWLAVKPFLDGVFGDMLFGSCYSKQYDHYLRRYACAYTWWYMMTKVVELLDTIFFVLRKKQNQVTFLHVYHHASTLLYIWASLKYLTGEQSAFVTCINSAVHVFMYTYYMLAAMGQQYQKYTWWKKYLTILQLVQFIVGQTYLIITFLYDCQMPKLLSFLYFVDGLILISLFALFYQRTYKKASKKQE